MVAVACVARVAFMSIVAGVAGVVIMSGVVDVAHMVSMFVFCSVAVADPVRQVFVNALVIGVILMIALWSHITKLYP